MMGGGIKIMIMIGRILETSMLKDNNFVMNIKNLYSGLEESPD